MIYALIIVVEKWEQWEAIQSIGILNKQNWLILH